MAVRVPYNLAHAQLAQMDRASASEAEGHWFDSSTAHHNKTSNYDNVLCSILFFAPFLLH